MSRDRQSEQTQRTVADLVAQHGGDTGTRRRRHRRGAGSDTGPAGHSRGQGSDGDAASTGPQEIIDRIAGESGSAGDARAAAGSREASSRGGGPRQRPAPHAQEPGTLAGELRQPGPPQPRSPAPSRQPGPPPQPRSPVQPGPPGWPDSTGWPEATEGARSSSSRRPRPGSSRPGSAGSTGDPAEPATDEMPAVAPGPARGQAALGRAALGQPQARQEALGQPQARQEARPTPAARTAEWPAPAAREHREQLAGAQGQRTADEPASAAELTTALPVQHPAEHPGAAERKQEPGGVAAATPSRSHTAGRSATADAPDTASETDDTDPDGESVEGDAAAATWAASHPWVATAVQLVLGVLAGAAVWLLFNWLWMNMPAAALIAAVAVTVALVWGVRAGRREGDLGTSVLAGLVGLVVTASPAAMLFLGS